ncbi:ParA family protein [Paenibacillus odorifer]|uniref:Cobyrinic acid ac-diamide synthase n=1 Tax=Paenibacillus odorifer TaxID=189426 RepID=A0A1R0XL45_9BACL|nr:ParA family protein [Paenibacillus odorifer]OMD35687.1 cobyrinic acid ac-diamide synthase [Paenibacillus odorifer]
MATVISFGIQKGGSAKTTTSGIVAHILSEEYGKRVLAVDLDSQGNLTELLSQQDIYDFYEMTVFEALKEQDAKKYIHKVRNRLDILPAEDHLARFPSWLYESYRGNRSLVLKDTLKNVQELYDYIIIDTPPALGDQTINALAASDAVVAMFEASKFCYSAIGRFLETCVHVQDKVNPDLKISGILRSLIDARRTDNKALIELIEEEYGELCFSTIMTRTAAIGRLSINGFTDNPELNQGLKLYRDFVKELIKRVETR